MPRNPSPLAAQGPKLLLGAVVLVGLLVAVAVQNWPRRPRTIEDLPPIEVYFSPHGGCTAAVVREIGEAQKTLLVQAYSFTSAPIADAVAEAHRRGVAVAVLLDKSQRTEKYSSADFLLHNGVTTLIDDDHNIAHNKIMIIDGRTVITGSFNFSKNAENENAENLLVIRDEKLAAIYTDNWQAHRQHSEPYTGKEAGPSGGHSSGRHRKPAGH